MKKIVFAAKVLGLLAMLPIVVIMEMNHNAGNSSELNPHPGDVKKKQVNDRFSSNKAKDKTGNEVSAMHSEILLIK